MIEYSPADDFERAQLYKLTYASGEHDRCVQSLLSPSRAQQKAAAAVTKVDLRALEGKLSSTSLSGLAEHLSSAAPVLRDSTQQQEHVEIRGPQRGWKDAVNEEYKQQWYWEDRFKEEESFEWLVTFQQVEKFMAPYLQPGQRIIVIGCGNRSLSRDLYDRGFRNITSIDFSSTVIGRMQEECCTREGMKWEVMDMLDMTFPAASFDVVIDKVNYF